MSEKLHVAVPTATIIVCKESNLLEVAVFRSGKKHNGKLVLPGGRVRLGEQNWVDAAIAEAMEELHLNVTDVEFFCIASHPNRDVRDITLSKLLDGKPVPTGLSEEMPIVGHYCFDAVFTGKTADAPIPDNTEAVEALFIHLDDLNPEDFALDHGKILLTYREYIGTAKRPSPTEF